MRQRGRTPDEGYDETRQDPNGTEQPEVSNDGHRARRERRKSRRRRERGEKTRGRERLNRLDHSCARRQVVGKIGGVDQHVDAVGRAYHEHECRHHQCHHVDVPARQPVDPHEQDRGDPHDGKRYDDRNRSPKIAPEQEKDGQPRHHDEDEHVLRRGLADGVQNDARAGEVDRGIERGQFAPNRIEDGPAPAVDGDVALHSGVDGRHRAVVVHEPRIGRVCEDVLFERPGLGCRNRALPHQRHELRSRQACLHAGLRGEGLDRGHPVDGPHPVGGRA